MINMFQLVGEKQHKLQVDFIQLLFYQAPLSALLLSVIIPFVEPLPQLLANINALPISGFVSEVLIIP